MSDRPGSIGDVPAGGVAKRERPVLELGSGGVAPRPGTLGPFGGLVRVVPIDGLSANVIQAFTRDASAASGVIFEVVLEWYGPGLPQLPPPGRDVEASDRIAAGDDLELAQAIAHAAAELLRDGRLPWLGHLKEELERAGGDWRGRYAARVGDGDRPQPWKLELP